MGRMTGNGGQVSGLIADFEHAQGQRRQQIRLRQGIGEAPAVADLFMHPVDGRHIMWLGDDIARGFSRSPARARHCPRAMRACRRYGPCADRASDRQGLELMRDPQRSGLSLVSRCRSTNQIASTSARQPPKKNSRLAHSQVEAPSTKAAPPFKRFPRSLNTGSNCGTTKSKKKKRISIAAATRNNG